METLLTRLQQSFSTWRASSTSKNRHSNAQLRSQAVNCLEHHSYREVSTAIGMSATTLRAWQKAIHRDQPGINSSVAFVKMSLDNTTHRDISAITHLGSESIQISLSNGVIVHVNASDLRSLVTLIVSLNKELSLCSI